MPQESKFFEDYFQPRSTDVAPKNISEAINQFKEKFTFSDAAKCVRNNQMFAICNSSSVNEEPSFEKSDSIAISQYTERLLYYLNKFSD